MKDNVICGDEAEFSLRTKQKTWPYTTQLETRHIMLCVTYTEKQDFTRKWKPHWCCPRKIVTKNTKWSDQMKGPSINSNKQILQMSGSPPQSQRPILSVVTPRATRSVYIPYGAFAWHRRAGRFLCGRCGAKKAAHLHVLGVDLWQNQHHKQPSAVKDNISVSRKRRENRIKVDNGLVQP